MATEQFAPRTGDLYYFDPEWYGFKGDCTRLANKPFHSHLLIKSRPWVILSTKEWIERINTVLIAPFTTVINKNAYKDKVLTSESGDRLSAVLVEQIRAVDKDALGSYIGHISNDTMNQIYASICEQFGIPYTADTAKSIDYVGKTIDRMFEEKAKQFRKQLEQEQMKNAADTLAAITARAVSSIEEVMRGCMEDNPPTNGPTAGYNTQFSGLNTAYTQMNGPIYTNNNPFNKTDSYNPANSIMNQDEMDYLNDLNHAQNQAVLNTLNRSDIINIANTKVDPSNYKECSPEELVLAFPWGSVFTEQMPYTTIINTINGPAYVSSKIIYELTKSSTNFEDETSITGESEELADTSKIEIIHRHNKHWNDDQKLQLIIDYESGEYTMEELKARYQLNEGAFRNNYAKFKKEVE